MIHIPNRFRAQWPIWNAVMPQTDPMRLGELVWIDMSGCRAMSRYGSTSFRRHARSIRRSVRTDGIVMTSGEPNSRVMRGSRQSEAGLLDQRTKRADVRI